MNSSRFVDPPSLAELGLRRDGVIMGSYECDLLNEFALESIEPTSGAAHTRRRLRPS